jgi:hypothetical protein
MTPRSLLSLNSLLPMKVTFRISVSFPSSDPGQFSLVDLEYQVDPVLPELNDLRLDAGGESPAASIQVDDALDVALHARPRVDHTRPELDLVLHDVVGNPLIAFERQPVDDGILDHAHDHRAALAAQRDVGEQPGREQRLQGFVERGGIDRVAAPERHVGRDGIGLDPLRALDPDLIDLETAAGTLRRGRSEVGARN